MSEKFYQLVNSKSFRWFTLVMTGLFVCLIDLTYLAEHYHSLSWLYVVCGFILAALVAAEIFFPNERATRLLTGVLIINLTAVAMYFAVMGLKDLSSLVLLIAGVTILPILAAAVLHEFIHRGQYGTRHISN